MADMIKTALGYVIPRSAHFLLSRSVTGQGGYQTRLRQLQEALGIAPSSEADAQSPRTGHVVTEAAINVARTMEPATAHTATADLDTLRTAAQRIKVLRDLGMQADADRLFTLHFGTIGTGNVPTSADTDDEPVNVEDLDAISRRANRARAEKAAMKALGRSRKSPKLTVASAAKRTYRMLTLHHGKGKVTAARMAEKYGKGWEKMIKG